MGTYTETTRLNEILIPRSDEVFVLIDSSKIGIRSFVTYASADKIKAVVTGQKPLTMRHPATGEEMAMPSGDVPVENVVIQSISVE